MVPIPEGQVLVICPYCDQRSLVAASPAPGSAPLKPPEAPALSGAAETSSVTAAAPQAQTAAVLLDLFGSKLPPQSVAALEGVGGLASAEKAPAPPVEENVEILGVRRYQAPLRITRDQAAKKLPEFLSGKMQIARDAAHKAQLREVFLVHLPFWAVWGKGVAYAFGQVKVGSGEHERWEAREKKAVREMTWNIPACEVGEFGVRQVSLEGCQLEPFNAEALHRSGMVFEPVGSAQNALETARGSFEAQIRAEVKMDRTKQLFTRLVRARLGLVYYPLWVLRYLYRGRSFQVVVDGFSGQILYGKAPGSVGYRAAALVGGMAGGALLAIDGPAFILSTSSSSSSSNDNPLIFMLILFGVGLVIMYAAYHTFRYAEHYEYHRFGKPKGIAAFTQPLNLPGSLRGVEGVINVLEKFS